MPGSKTERPLLASSPPELTTEGFHLQRGWGEETEVSAPLQLAVLHALQKSTQSMLCTADLSALRRLSSGLGFVERLSGETKGE